MDKSFQGMGMLNSSLILLVTFVLLHLVLSYFSPFPLVLGRDMVCEEDKGGVELRACEKFDLIEGKLKWT